MQAAERRLSKLSSMKLFLMLLFVFVTATVFSQTEIAGVWQGASVCQIKPSACHDEIVVYHIKKKEKANAYSVLMNKIVNGAEEDMATVEATLTTDGKKLEGYDTKWHTHWIFDVDGEKMNGVLLDKDGKTIFRKIKVEKLKD